MADVSDVLFRLRDMAAQPVEELREAIAKAQAVLDRLDKLADNFEDAAQLVASSNIEPTAHALAPVGSGYETPNSNGRPGSCLRCSYTRSVHEKHADTIGHEFVDPSPGKCSKCRHAAHGTRACLNAASDNDCDCKGVDEDAEPLSR